MKNDVPQKKWTAEEVKQWYKDTDAFTYINPNDLNVVVKKPRSEGLTVNWANPKAYSLLGIILAIVFIILHFVNNMLA